MVVHAYVIHLCGSARPCRGGVGGGDAGGGRVSFMALCVRTEQSKYTSHNIYIIHYMQV